VDQIIRIGIDTSKHVFQLHGVNAAEEPDKARRSGWKSSIQIVAQ
jgi:transposase